MKSPVARVMTAPRAAAAGIVAGAVALAASELLAGVIPGVPSLVIAVGSLVIALQPPGAKDVMTTLFGTNDKTALNVAVVVVVLLLAAVAGILGRRNFGRAWRLFVAFGFVAFVAAFLQPLDSGPLAALNAVVATAAGVGTLRVLLADAGFLQPVHLRFPGRPGAGQIGDAVTPQRSSPALSMPDWNRRRFLLRSGGLLGGAVVAGAFGRVLLERQHPSGAPVSASLPVSTEVVPPLSADESLAAPGITPLVVPNDQFYRIDTELLVPQVDASSWQLRVRGMVDHPLTFTYAELLALPHFEQYVTLQCVSNDVGGNLVGNALWTGVHLKAILAEAGIQTGATQIVGHSVDEQRDCGATTGRRALGRDNQNRIAFMQIGDCNRRYAAQHLLEDQGAPP